ncbi:MAG: hypothetical protein JNJ59_15685, partial [Deltaproteobacteria bacterium]|nr:hypothetical protein [Deltaproteobacteria bacterium]
MRSRSHLVTVSSLLSLSGGLGACLGDQSGPTSHLEIAVAPLTLPDIVDACYDLRVTNAPGGLGQTV